MFNAKPNGRETSDAGGRAGGPVDAGTRGSVPVRQARPLAFLPVYARRWGAYRNVNVRIVATRGWDRS